MPRKKFAKVKKETVMCKEIKPMHLKKIVNKNLIKCFPS